MRKTLLVIVILFILGIGVTQAFAQSQSPDIKPLLEKYSEICNNRPAKDPCSTGGGNGAAYYVQNPNSTSSGIYPNEGWLEANWHWLVAGGGALVGILILAQLSRINSNLRHLKRK